MDKTVKRLLFFEGVANWLSVNCFLCRERERRHFSSRLLRYSTVSKECLVLHQLNGICITLTVFSLVCIPASDTVLILSECYFIANAWCVALLLTFCIGNNEWLLNVWISRLLGMSWVMCMPCWKSFLVCSLFFSRLNACHRSRFDSLLYYCIVYAHWVSFCASLLWMIDSNEAIDPFAWCGLSSDPRVLLGVLLLFRARFPFDCTPNLSVFRCLLHYNYPTS